MRSNNVTFFLPDFCSVNAVLFLVLVAELLAIVVTLAGGDGFGWTAFANASLFLQWVVLTSAGCLCVLRRHIANWSLPAAASFSYALIILITLLVSLAGQWIEQLGSVAAFDPAKTLAHLVISAILAGIALRYFYLQQQLRLQQQAELQARIEALQARIRPHFLFNSMNSIASLITTDPDLAERVVEDLADLFRQSLSTEQTEVSMRDEIELCQRFARIEGLRLGERLQLEWQLDDLPEGLKIPRFTLQPLIENAIYHGVQPLAEGGKVSVVVSLEGERCHIVVSNPVGPGGREDGNRMALDNIERRLQAVYGGDAELKVLPGSDEFVVKLAYRWSAQGALG